MILKTNKITINQKNNQLEKDKLINTYNKTQRKP